MKVREAEKKREQTSPNIMGIKIAALRAGDGDAILVRCLNKQGNFNILIDGGRKEAIKSLDAYLETIAPEERAIDLLVLTHIDGDHIEGLLALAKEGVLGRKLIVRSIWFNDARHCAAPTSVALSPAQGDDFSKLIRECGFQLNEAFSGCAVCRRSASEVRDFRDGVRIHILGPTIEALRKLSHREWTLQDLEEPTSLEQKPKRTKLGGLPVPDVETNANSPHAEDVSLTNATSIAFVLEYGNRRLLMAADSHAKDMVAALSESFGGGPHEFDAAFFPHHGADGNMSRDLAEMLASRRWVISTTGARHKHPSPEAVSRVLVFRPDRTRQPTTLLFNSRHTEAMVWDNQSLQAQYNYTTQHPEPGANWIEVTLPP